MQEQEIQFKWLDAEIEILSEIQRHICEMIIEGHNDQEIIDCFHLRSHSNIRTCMKNTIMGIIWSPGKSNGGSPCYLSDVETFIFQKIIHNRDLDMDCIKTIEAVQIGFNCHEFRFARATELSQIMTRQCSPSKSIQRVLKSLEPYVPSSSWLTHFCEANEINIKNPVTLEAACRKYCNVGAITNFFQLYSGL